MTLLFVAPGWDPAPWRESFANTLPGHDFAVWSEPFDPNDIRYALAWHPPAGLFRNLPHLRAVLSLGAGVDHLLADPELPDIPIVRVIDIDLTARMSEWVVLNVLLHHRRLLSYQGQQNARQWHDLPDQPAAKDVRVGVLGLGELGTDAAVKLSAIGFDVAGWSRRPKTDAPVRHFAGLGERDAFLARTDILVVLLPLTPDTRGILNRNLFARLARDGRIGGPVLINAGRGGLQVERDILAALDDGILAGASLDVFEREPLPKTSPLWRHPRVVITPHNASVSDPAAIATSLAADIRRIEAGQQPLGLVDRSTGY